MNSISRGPKNVNPLTAIDRALNAFLGLTPEVVRHGQELRAQNVGGRPTKRSCVYCGVVRPDLIRDSLMKYDLWCCPEQSDCEARIVASWG